MSDDALPTNDTYFAFDGTNSDLARQLYLRAKAGDSAPKLDNLVLPDALDERLDSLKLQWDELPGIAQRALLWDSGFVLTINNKVVQVWPLDGYSMSELAVPLPQFNAVNCTEMNCTHPEFDNIKSFSNLYCNGDEMRQAARCVVEDFDDDGAFHLAMWMTGGNPKVVPIPLVRKHSWVDNGSNISYEVAAVHTVESEQEATYGECPTAEKNGGYGSLVLPCYLQSDISEKEGIKNAMIKVQGSPWMSRWLKDYSSSKSAGDTFNSGGFKVALVAPIAGVLLVIGLLALVVLVKRKRRNIEVDALENSLIDLETRCLQDKPHDSDFTLDTSVDPTLDDTLSVSHRGVDKTIKFLPSSSSASDFDSGSNSTLQILLRSDFLVGKRIPFDSLEFKRSLSKGACGEVWLAEFQGQRVAVKRLLQAKTHRADEVEEFAQEIELSASLIHPNIVTFVGVAWNSLNNLVMVLEFFPTGDLQTFLAKKEDLLSWSRDKIRIALGVGRALEYLHSRSPPLIHRDLKSKNILLTDQLEAKLIDFGVSRIRQEHSMTAGVGTPYWTAPEILEGKRYTEQADLYSFGVVLSELDTGKLPYHDALTSEGKKLKPFQILADVMAGMLRPSFSEGCPSKIRRIGVACCQHDQSRRPTAAQVVAMLQD